MSEVSKYHNPQFDPVLQEAHNFVANDLGLKVGPQENFAMITEQQAVGLRQHHGETWGGGYNPDNDTGVVIQKAHLIGPRTTRVYNGAVTAHEISHSGTANEHEHTFYQEALPGMVEYKYMERLKGRGLYVPAADFILHRAGAVLWIPKNMRYIDAADAAGAPRSGEKGGHISQGLIAALGIAHALPGSGLGSNDLLAMSSKNGSAAYYGMKHVLNTLKPGLAREVESTPQTTDGIIQATAIVQQIARQKGLL